jgi:nucleoside-diphosphate-sugar epimerase
MKVFITGGGGFLGYRLALRLLERKTLGGPDGKPARRHCAGERPTNHSNARPNDASD